MPPLMGSLMRTRPVVLALAASALGAFAAGCTGSSTTPTTAASTTTPTESPIPSGPIVFVPGEFVTDIADVRSELTWNGGEGTLHVTNASTTDVGAPSLYAITNEPVKVNAEVVNAAPVAPGDEATFTVRFPDTLDPADAGLLILSFGAESWGAMQPVVQ